MKTPQDSSSLEAAKRKFAVFDIDGTIIRWQLYHAIVDKLVSAGHIKPEQFKAAHDARMAWKQRAHEASFKEYEESLVKMYDAAVVKISIDDYQSAVQMAFDEYKTQTYTYTRNLLHSLKSQGYLLFAISASQVQIVKLLADYYGFDDYGGTHYKITNNHFTGTADVLKRERKPLLLKELIAKHNADTSDSIGIGDSDSDIPLLASVARPIAFNPDKILFQYAKEHSWPVIIERKNMIYKLTPKDDAYVLTDDHVA